MKLLPFKKGELKKRLERYAKNDVRLAKVLLRTKREFDRSKLPAHNWEHAYRDVLNAIVIGEAEGADMSIVLPAIAMHDIGFLYGATGKTHGAVGAKKLPTFLKKIGASYPPAMVRAMAECIHTHKGSMHGEKPATLEAKVVCDADLLEKFGSFGVYQYIRTYTEFDWDLETVIRRGNGILQLRLETKTGKKLVGKGRRYVAKFFGELDKANDPYRA